MSNIKSKQATDLLDGAKINTYGFPFGVVDMQHARRAVELAEQEAEKRAIKAFSVVIRKLIGLLPVEEMEREFKEELFNNTRQ